MLRKKSKILIKLDHKYFWNDTNTIRVCTLQLSTNNNCSEN